MNPKQACLPRALLLATALLLVAAAAPAAAADALGGPSCTEAPKTATCVQLGGDVVMWWWISNTHKTITAKVVHAGEWGWVALGLSESGGMRGADIGLTEVGGNGTAPTVTDMYALEYGMPNTDTKQNWEVLEASVGGGRTAVKLRRKLDTCDSQDIPVMQGVQQFVIWARGLKWPQKHKIGNVGYASVLLQPFGKKQTAQIDTVKATIPANHPDALNDTSGGGNISFTEVQLPADAKVPNTSDAYRCKTFHLPPDVRHITSFTPLLPNDTASEHAIHHMVVYACNSEPKKITLDAGTVPCNVVPEFACSRIVTVWVPGTGANTLPEEAGLLVGNTTGGLEWVVLQVHYSNLALTPGLNGSAGIHMEMTDKLRPYEVGTLTLGNMKLAIPPGQVNYAVQPAWCPAACTSKFKSPWRIIASQTHMHRAGQGISTRIFRNGTELQPLVVKKAYDFDHQTFTDPPTDLRAQFIYPGDELLTQCSFTTTGRTNTTWWGEDTASEMCFNFLMYYPRDPYLENCLSYGSMPEALKPLLPGMGLDVNGTYDLYSCSNFDTLGNTSRNMTSEENRKMFASGDWGLTNSTRSYKPWVDPQCTGSKKQAGRRLL